MGLGAQILRDLGVKSIRLITSSSRHFVGLSGFDIEIAETIRGRKSCDFHTTIMCL